MADVDPTLAAITDTYTDWLATHGADSSRGVGWHDPQMQALRFDVLALVMEGAQPVTVADFGCGTGALFDRLAARAGPPPLGGYTGYDLVPAMVETARERHSDPRARFEVGSTVTEDHDYVLASGVFTIRPGIDDAAWEAQLHEVIAGLWARARRGIAFNIMIRTPKPAEPHIYTGDPEGWAVWCSQNLPGARVALRMGPPLDDFTVLVRRAPSGE
jgi:SAM-dependent methyltransferase